MAEAELAHGQNDAHYFFQTPYRFLLRFSLLWEPEINTFNPKFQFSTSKMISEELEWLETRLRKYDSSRAIHNSPSPEAYESVAKSSFYLLPLEIRRKILTAAFGNHTLHIGLINSSEFRDLGINKSDSKSVRWQGGICTRKPDQSPFGDHCTPGKLGVMGWLLSSRLGFVMYSGTPFTRYWHC